MLFKQSELQEPSFLDEAMNIISNTSFLSESEGFYHPSMVSIRENVSLGKNLIKLEDLVEYSISNGITNAGQAIQTICEQNGIETDSIGFSVNETSIIADRDMADTVAAFQEGGMDVYINPISSMDPVYQITTSIVEAMIDNAGTENEAYFDHLFESFINDSYEDIINEAEVVNNVNGKEETVQNTADQAQNDTDGFWARKIAALKSTYRKLKEKAAGATGTAKQKILEQMQKVSDAIKHLKEKFFKKKEACQQETEVCNGGK